MTGQHTLTIEFFTEYLAAFEARIMGAMQKGFAALNVRMDTLEERLDNVAHRLGRVEVAVEDLKDDMASVMKAIDHDAPIIIDHERRITRLEGTVIAA